jgi:hypothetical protein
VEDNLNGRIVILHPDLAGTPHHPNHQEIEVGYPRDQLEHHQEVPDQVLSGILTEVLTMVQVEVLLLVGVRVE